MMETSKAANNQLSAFHPVNLLNSIPNRLALLDLDGNIVAMNNAWKEECQKYTDSFSEIVEGNNFFEVCQATQEISSEDRRRIESGLKQIIKGDRREIDYKIPIYLENRVKWLLFHANRTSGEFSGVIISVTPISTEQDLERELVESENRFRALFEHAFDAIFFYDFSGRIFDVNSAAGRLIGDQVGELARMTLTKILAPPEPGFGDMKPKIKASRVQFEIDLQVPGKRTLTLHVGCRVINSEEGIVQCIARDISDNKLIIDAMRSSEEKYRNIVEHASEGIIVLKEGIITYINSKAADIFGYPIEKLIHKPMMDFVYEEDHPLVDSYYRLHARGEKDSRIYIFRTVSPKGQTKFIECNGIGMEWENSPAVLKFLTNVTWRIETEKALKESEARYKMLFEESPFSVWEEDFSETLAFAKNLKLETGESLKTYLTNNPDIVKKAFSLANVVDVNNASVKIFEAPNKSELANMIPTMICEEGIGKFAEALLAMLDGVTAWDSEILMPRYDGTVFPAYLKGALAPGHGGQYTKVYISLLDMSDLKKAEQSLRESEEKYRLLVEQSSMGLVIYQEDKVAFANKMAASLIKYPLEELLEMEGAGLDSMIYPEDREYAREQWDKCIANPSRPIQYEAREIIKDNKVRWLEFNLTGITYHGKPAVQILFGDITERKEAEEQLIQQRNLLSSIISNIPHHIFWKDRECRYLGCNSNFAEVAGVGSPDKIPGLTDYDLAWKKEESDAYIKWDQEIMKSGEPLYNLIETQNQADGNEAIIQTSKVPLRNYSGEVIGILGIYLDITEQKEAEEKLEMSNSLMRASLDSAFDGILVTNLGGAIQDFNLKFLEMWGISEEDAAINGEKTIFDLLFDHLDNPEGFRNHLDDARIYAGNGITDLISLKNGKIFEFNSLPQVLGGKSIGRVWSFHNITDMVKSEQKLSQIVNRYTTMIDTVPAALYAKDENLCYVVANQMFCKRIGKPRADVVGKTDTDLDHPELAKNFSSTDLQVLEQDISIISREEEIVVDNGEPGWFSITKVPLKNESGQNIGIVGLIQDITEQRRSREQLIQSDKLAAIGTLAAGVAHEINNPMGYISSNLNVMKKYVSRFKKFLDESTDQESETYQDVDEILTDFNDAVDESLEGAGRVKEIVADLKSFSRVDKAESSFADINDGIRSTLNIVWNELKYHCKVETDYGEIPELFCLPNQLNQVFMNILINAGQAITHKSGLIKVKTWADKEYINVSVKDNGIGISEQNVKKIFEPFFTTKDVGKGTGLGLSLVFDIIKKHKGTIDVRSKEGEGSEFIIQLPLGGIDAE